MIKGIEKIATKNDLAELRDDLSKMIRVPIKWMFLFWISQIGATLVIILLLLKK